MNDSGDKPDSSVNPPDGEAKPDTTGGEKTYWLDDPKNVQKVIRIFLVCCVLLLALDGLFFAFEKHLSFGDEHAAPDDHGHAGTDHQHGEAPANEFPYEGWFGFYSLYGFVACVLLVLIAKQMRKVLKRSEDYYS